MNEQAPKVFTLIINWNGKEDTLNCLQSVREIDYPNYTTVVMDNGSVDDWVAVIKNQFPEVTSLENGANLGFAGGNNTGIEYPLAQGADYIYLLNNDTFVDPQVLWALIRAAEEYPEAGIFGSKIYYYAYPEKIWYAGTEWLNSHARFIHVGYGKKDDGSWSEIKETDYICGCALLIRSEVVQKIGLLESKYFLMWEESDWCYRARRAFKAALQGMNGYVFRRFGDCPEWLRSKSS